MQVEINKFITTIFKFSIPFILLLIVLIYLDPYNIIRKEQDDKMKKIKNQISYKINYPLYALQKYYNSPTDIIVLGDSRANSLSEDLFRKIAGKEITNLAYGGGSIQEIIDTFWIVSKMHKLKEVYIGINFNLYNQLNKINRVTEAENIRNSIPTYLISKYCLKSSLLILKSILTGEKVSIEKPFLNKEQFWKFQLKSSRQFFVNYIYPEDYYRELKKISYYCNQNNISLVFFIPPIHKDLQSKIVEFKLEEEYIDFLDDLESLRAPIYNFNLINDKTVDKKQFSDPFHFNKPLREIVTGVITGDKYYLEQYKKYYKQK